VKGEEKALFVKGEEKPRGVWDNQRNDNRQLVEGNQEDVDLVIATGHDLILVEAKAYGGWSNSQMKSKLARLELLHAFYKKMTPPAKHVVHFHLLLVSPKCPQKLECHCPCWLGKRDDFSWIMLPLADPNTIFETTRCDESGNRSADGKCWRVLRHKNVAHETTSRP
jgi:hypothetical protein